LKCDSASTNNRGIKTIKKMKNIKNKHVIRKENKKGKFTTVKYTILRDERLNSNAKILMIEILSDSDRFDFSETLFMDRMGVGPKAYRAALRKLVESGYVRKTPIKNTANFHYTISEYGNLKDKDITTEEPVDESNLQPEVETVDIPSTPKLSREELLMKLAKFIIPLQDFLTPDIAETYTELTKGDFDVYEVKSKLIKLIEKEKLSYFNSIANEVKNSSSNIDVKVEALRLLKKEVFDNNDNKITSVRVRTRASANINRKKSIDPETLAADRPSGTPKD